MLHKHLTYSEYILLHNELQAYSHYSVCVGAVGTPASSSCSHVRRTQPSSHPSFVFVSSPLPIILSNSSCLHAPAALHHACPPPRGLPLCNLSLATILSHEFALLLVFSFPSRVFETCKHGTRVHLGGEHATYDEIITFASLMVYVHTNWKCLALPCGMRPRLNE